MALRRLKPDDEMDAFMCQVCKLMDEAPEWRDWFEVQLALMDKRYDPFYALRLPMEKIRG